MLIKVFDLSLILLALCSKFFSLNILQPVPLHSKKKCVIFLVLFIETMCMNIYQYYSPLYQQPFSWFRIILSLFFLTITLSFHSSQKCIRVFSAFLGYIIWDTSETAMNSLFTAILYALDSQIVHREMLVYVFSLTSMFISIILLFLIRFYLSKCVNGTPTQRLFIVSSLFINFSMISLFFYIYALNPNWYSYFIFLSGMQEITYVVIFLLGCLNGILICTLVTEIQHTHDKQYQLQTIEVKATYARELERINQIDNSYRKDSLSYIQKLNQSIEEEDINTLKELLNNAPSSIFALEHSSEIDGINNININGLKSLIHVKIICAQMQHIIFHLEIPEPIESLPMVPYDLIRIVGIFLDNAIDAAKDSPNPYIGLALYQLPDQTILILENSCKEQVLPISSLKEKGSTSKGKGHGMGLYIINQILENYPDVVLYTQTVSNLFIQKLSFPK